MKYIKLLGHYYKDGYFGNCSNNKRPIVEDITLGHPGTIKITSDQGDTLYVYHDTLSNTPEYIKKVFENGTYTNGAVIYNALENDDDFPYPDEAEVIIIPQTNYRLNGPNEIHYDIYWPYDLDEDPISIWDRGRLYDSKDIPTYPLYTATNDGINLTTSGKVLSASDVYGLSACDVYGLTGNVGIDALTYARPYTVDDRATISYQVTDRISDIDDRLTRLENQNQTKGKENKFMNLNNLFGNLRVGKAGRDYAITYYGTVSYKGKT